jgi:undecaprenyl-diphosphatase
VSRSRALPLGHALALGLVHGPAELLPISSSGHLTLIPWLAGWPYDGLDARSRKSFEVTLHAGTATALLLCRPLASARPGFLGAAVLPPALAGCILHGPIERRLGTPATIAAGLLAGSLGVLAAEIRAARRRAPRGAEQAGVGDGLALGAAQALALLPGISRSGAAFAAARARGFRPGAAERLSLAAGLPVLGGAALLQGSKLARGGPPSDMRRPLAVGAVAAFASTRLACALLGPQRRSRAAVPAALYRMALAGVVIERVRTTRVRTSAQLIKKASHRRPAAEAY